MKLFDTRTFGLSVIATCFLAIPVVAQTKSNTVAAPSTPVSKKAETSRGAATPSQAGVVVVKDAETGQLRQATPEEIGALVNAAGVPQTFSRAVIIQPSVVSMPNGYTTVSLGPEQMSYSVMTKTADGKLVESCVVGADAAKNLVESTKQQSTKTREKLDDK